MLDSTVLELYNEFNGLDTFKDVSTAVSFLNHLEDAGMIEKLGEEIVSELTYILNAKQTASYLEGGVNNRITMSIRSAIASEIDWALDRLIVVSYTEPDILRLTDFPGLLNGLLDLVRDFVDAVNGLHGAPELIRGEAEFEVIQRIQTTHCSNCERFGSGKPRRRREGRKCGAQSVFIGGSGVRRGVCVPRFTWTVSVEWKEFTARRCFVTFRTTLPLTSRSYDFDGSSTCSPRIQMFGRPFPERSF